MAIRIYPRVIDLVAEIRANGGISNDVKYAKGKAKYYNIIDYIEKEYHATHRQAMDAAKYFMC
jgi:iron-sulfur cluster repair protein YtfE (RIC family)